MENTVTNGQPIVGYAQPLSRLQVSWGAVLAGAITTFAVSLILWALALAVILTAAHATVGSIGGAAVAIWVTALVTTLVGAFAGGMVAGYLPGNPRRAITCAHGFLAWCVAFLVAAMVQGSVIAGITRAATTAAVTTAATAVQATSATVGPVAGGQLNLDQKARDLLTSLGYTPAEAARMVASARQDVQNTLRGNVTPSTAGAAETARGALDTVLRWAAVYTWLWFADWAIAGGLAVLGANVVLKRVRKVPLRERAGLATVPEVEGPREPVIAHA